MRVTVDLNVFLDVFQNRPNHYAASAQVLRAVKDGTIEGVVPARALTTIYYIVRRHAAKPDAETALDRILAEFQICSLDAQGWQQARHLKIDDFEDAVVAATAVASNSSFIVTRNLDDFRGSPVPAVLPAVLLATLSP